MDRIEREDIYLNQTGRKTFTSKQWRRLTKKELTSPYKAITYADPGDNMYRHPYCKNCQKHIDWDLHVKDWYHTATGKLTCNV